MRWGPAILAAHNGFLSVASAAMFGLVVVEAWGRAQVEGWGFVLCERFDPPRSYALEAYYISKYYELLDTVLAFACRGKPPRRYFTHCYHHALVMYTGYFCAQGQTLRYPGMATNTFVHIFMYYYYARAAIGLRSTWKIWVTRVQVLQFATTYVSLLLALRKTPNLFFDGTKCSGRFQLVFTCAFSATLLHLFLKILDDDDPKKKQV
ncbi:hypothetical protein CTAYLR_004003 [Chrysophaeum taylorii]|uniref:Elongation of fatty acids protein n=1 Tax=Chrysophaeum taylorii TaxID=2483200 RepID=A0AAD7U7R3_9STRA|nr:hypothetical protein CTAYLR_004003 [Chrysophaeum taylorii]